MRVLMVTPGTRGDVAPMAGLASRLRSHGHEVTIAANNAHASLVSGAGCGFSGLPGDMGHLVSPAEPGTRAAAADLRRYMRELGDYMELAAQGTLAAAGKGTDVILANAVAPYAYDVGEALGIPVLGAHLQPVQASTAYPPVTLGLARSLGPVANRTLGAILSRSKAPYDAPAAGLRRTLGLPPMSRASAEHRRRKANSPILHGISPAVLPRPRDWHPGLSLAGYWWPLAEPTWQPSAELAGFLADGPAPVYIGFGSTAAMDADFMVDVARRAGVRAVLQGVDGVSDSNVISVGTIPHAWLFPRVSAVVHHAGAGTTAAGLRAGVPSVGVPVFTDQPFWAARVAALGAGPAPIPYKKLTPQRLADSIKQAVETDGFAREAKHVASLLAAEDSTAPVLDALRTAVPHA
ncbi:glycosyltransferase [Arthrobacter livingstonensis]|nr:glycosyltransferase [Arthrobacter livingstonensis]